jgi:prevent-host-death family protein
MQVNIHDAKTHFSRLLEQVEKGESVVIARSGKPVAKLVPLDSKAGKALRLGIAQGEFKVPDDFDRLAEDEIEALFGGENKA